MSERMQGPKQVCLYAVWVKVDDGIGWRIVHENNSESDCIAMAASHVVFGYPVLHVEVRFLPNEETGESLPATKLYEYPGDMP